MTEKYIGYFRLLEACDRPGCPVCAYLDDVSRRQITTLFDEHVTDVTTRQHLRASWGLCSWHAWQALDARATATGVAIVYEDLLRVCHERLAHRGIAAEGPRHSGRAGRLRAWLRAIFGKAPPRFMRGAVAAYRDRPRCALCADLRLTEAHCLDALIHFADDPQFSKAYERSAGLCLPHLVAVMERGSCARSLQTIVQRTLAKWQDLRSDLEKFVTKHEYRSSSPFSDVERRSTHLALELLAGRRNILGNDMRGD